MLSKTGARDIGTDLITFALDPEDAIHALRQLPSTAKADRDTIQYESRFLRLFAVDYGITLGLGSNNPEKEAVSNWYFASLDSVVRDFPGNIGPRFLDILRDRIDKYVRTLKRYSDKDPFSVIGESFAKLCGNEEDTELCAFGKDVFLSTANGVAEYLRSVEIKP